MSLSIPPLKNVKLIAGIIGVLILIGIAIGVYSRIKTTLSEKDKQITRLETLLKTEVTNSSVERGNVATLRKDLYEITMANEALSAEYELAQANYTKWKEGGKEVRYKTIYVKEIINIPATETDFCKAAKIFNEKVSGLKYEDI